jgi:hypothetical protein
MVVCGDIVTVMIELGGVAIQKNTGTWCHFGPRELACLCKKIILFASPIRNYEGDEECEINTHLTNQAFDASMTQIIFPFTKLKC